MSITRQIRRVGRAWWVGCCTTGLILAAAQAGESPAPLGPSTNAPLAIWDRSARLEIGGGYRDNPTLSSISPQSSSLFVVGGDFSLARLSESGSEFLFFVLGESAEYLGDTTATGDRFVSASVRYNLQLDKRNQFLSECYYLYQHQIMDVSESQEEFRPVLVEGNAVGVRPGWKHKFSEVWSGHLELGAHRQFYQGDLDDYWEPALRSTLACDLSPQSEVGVTFQTLHWLYDTRPQTDAQGDPISGTSLTYWRPELSGYWTQYWDERRRWRTTLKTGWLWNVDNAAGYYDYDRYSIAAQLRWKPPGWTFSGGGRFAWYFYQNQYVLDELRHRSFFLLEARVERALGRHWFVFASAEHEWDMSNDPLDDYTDWQARAGIGYDF